MSAQLHILVVDDSDTERKVTVELLTKEAYLVTTARSVRQAKDVLRAYNSAHALDSIRVVVLESDLGGVDAIEDLLPISEEKLKVSPQVILLNRDSLHPGRHRKAIGRGAYLILHKAHTLDRLVPTIQQLFDLK
ncbi:MAG: hypothetical protein AAB381_00635 [Patescibacteria group bacterium]